MEDLSLIIGGLKAGLDTIIASPLAQTALGGVIGVYSAGKAVDRQIRADREAGEKADAATISRLKLGLRVELEAVVRMTKESIGAAFDERHLQGDDGTVAFVFPIESDYFTLFSRNAGSLGQVDVDTAEAVIEAYVALKSMVDSFRYNNGLLGEHQMAQLRVGDSGNAEWALEHLTRIKTQLMGYGPLLVRTYEQTLVSVEVALKALRASDAPA